MKEGTKVKNPKKDAETQRKKPEERETNRNGKVQQTNGMKTRKRNM